MMKKLAPLIILMLMPMLVIAQVNKRGNLKDAGIQQEKTYTFQAAQLTLEAAVEIANRAKASARALEKEVTVAVLDASGQTMVLLRGDGVGPHNTEAARRKAYTSLSTKKASLLLAREARANPDSQNLANLPELLLLAGGHPLWHKGVIIGSVGVAGGGSPENDDAIAKSAQIPEANILTKQ
jgi:uncharacterized protein GlcG (DUF336 family)